MAKDPYEDEFGSGNGLMGEPPSMAVVPLTIDDAELEGWQSLGIWCRGCGTTFASWRGLRRETRYRRLDEIAARFRCKKCRSRPAHVWLYWRGGWDGKNERELTILEAPNEPTDQSA